MRVFGDVDFLDKVFLRNLEIYPLVYRGEGGNGVKSLGELMAQNAVVLNDVLDVNSISLHNKGTDSLLILEGESIVGARQDRIFNATSVVEAGVETVLPVSCVEQGRWSGGGTFRDSATIAFPSLRSVLRSSVTRNLISSGKRLSDQGAVWSVVKETLTATKTMSNTMSMHDAYSALKNEIERYTEELSGIGNVTGYMVFVGDKFVSLDVFPSRELLKKYEMKLFESYAMQGILERFGHSGLKSVKLDVGSVKEFDGLTFKEFKGVSGEKDLRYAGNVLIEVVINKEEKMLYASAIPSPD